MKTTKTSFVATCALALVALAAPSWAANVNWGDLTTDDSTVIFVDVTEDNSQPSTLFAPEATGPSVAGDQLLFAPVGFQSQSQNSADLVDSTLSFMVEAKEGFSIDEVYIQELGDYSLGGLSDGEAFAEVGAAFFWWIAEVDGSPINMGAQITELDVTDGGRYDRPDDDGTAVPWVGDALLDVAGLAEEYEIEGKITKVTVRFDNALQTAADEFSNAFIKKKGVDITVTTTEMIIPEPAAALLAALAMVGGTVRRRF